MASLLLVIFVVQLAADLINSIGASTINELLWILYNKFPTKTSKAAQDNIRLRREVVRLKREMNAVSAQDEFSKWAKLRRQHDKAMAQYELSDATIRSTKSSFDTTFTAIRLVGINGLRFFIQFWYANVPLFWIPEGWLPKYVEWILAFPRAPMGSISVQIWQIACASIIGMVREAVTAVYVLATKKAADQQGGNAQAVPAGGSEKKEL